MKPDAFIRSARMPGSECPNCHEVLNGVTGASLNGPMDFAHLAGNPTVCAYCGVVAVFADDQGHLRAPTAAESVAFAASPEVQMIVRFVRERMAEEGPLR